MSYNSNERSNPEGKTCFSAILKRSRYDKGRNWPKK
jgi:hypothetical protein